MSQYDGSHSVTFINSNGKQMNSWSDWQLIPSSRPVISPPPVQEFSLTIPGRSGKIDFQDYILKEPVFDNREGSLEFVVDHENKNYISWSHTYNEILEFLHGQWLKLILSDTPSYYYEGRFKVNDFKSNSDWSTIVIDYDLIPYKKSVTATMSQWKWDPFSFITGYVREAADFEFYANSAQGRVPILLEGVKGDSQVQISAGNASTVYELISKTAAGTERILNGKGTDILTLTINADSPEFYVNVISPTATSIKFYVKYIEGVL